MAQTLWLNDRCNELLAEIKELEPTYDSKTGVTEKALEHYAESLRDQS